MYDCQLPVTCRENSQLAAVVSILSDVGLGQATYTVMEYDPGSRRGIRIVISEFFI